MTHAELVQRLRQSANIDGRRALLAQFEADLRLVYEAERDYGHQSAEEAGRAYREARNAVRARLADPDWMAGAIAHFRQLAAAIEADRARRDRIAAEVRATRPLNARSSHAR